MLLRFDPFREMDRLADELVSGQRTPRMMPMDADRAGDHVVLHFDLPGVDPGSIDLGVEQNVLAVRAERTVRPEDGATVIIAERPTGTYQRSLVLGEGLDLEKVHASYDNGVLTVTVPVAERSKPRKIEVSGSGHQSGRVIEGDRPGRQPTETTG